MGIDGGRMVNTWPVRWLSRNSLAVSTQWDSEFTFRTSPSAQYQMRSV